MTQQRINKLKALAERGVGGERDNARAMLEKAGISWKKSVVQQVKEVVTGNEEIKTWRIRFDSPSDLLLLAMLAHHMRRDRFDAVIDGKAIKLDAKESEMIKITAAYNKLRASFDSYIRGEAAFFLSIKL